MGVLTVGVFCGGCDPHGEAVVDRTPRHPERHRVTTEGRRSLPREAMPSDEARHGGGSNDRYRALGNPVRDRLAECVPGTDPDAQNRTGMKHRAVPPAVLVSSATGVTVTDLLGWPVPAVVGSPGVRNATGSIDPREDGLYTATVDVWVAKLSEDDCDIHLEVAAPGAGPEADRVIVELPQGPAFDAVRTTVADLLAAQDRGLQRGTMPRPLQVTLTGYGFYDVHHACSRDPQRGCTHGSVRVGTLWELHPVVALTAAGP